MTDPDRKPIRVMFLGDRRIAWEALKLMCTPDHSSSFELCGVVSSTDILENYITLAEAQGINPAPVRLVNDRRHNSAIIQAIQDHSVNLVLSVQYNWVLPPEVLNAVGRQAFNLHNGKLPDYKGYNSVSHAIANGDERYHPTIHWMDDKVDCGDLAFVGDVRIEPDDTAYSLYDRSVSSAVELFGQLLMHLAGGRKPPRIAMEPGEGVFYSKNSVKKLADLTEIDDAATIDRVARAAFFPPYNVAFRREGEWIQYVIPPQGYAQLKSVLPAVNKAQFTPQTSD